MSDTRRGAKLKYSKKQITEALRKHDGIILRASKELNTTVQTVINYINRYNIDNNAIRMGKRLADLEIMDSIIRKKAIDEKSDKWLRYLHELDRQSLGYAEKTQKVEQTVNMESKVEVKHEFTTDERLAAIMAILDTAGARAGGQTISPPAE